MNELSTAEMVRAIAAAAVDLPNLAARIRNDAGREMPTRLHFPDPDAVMFGRSTEPQMVMAMAAVENVDGWKQPVDTTFPDLADHERSVIEDAMSFYAGSPVWFWDEGPGRPIRVEAAGYYASIGA